MQYIHSLTDDGATLRLDQMLSVAKVTAFQLRRAFGGSDGRNQVSLGARAGGAAHRGHDNAHGHTTRTVCRREFCHLAPAQPTHRCQPQLS